MDATFQQKSGATYITHQTQNLLLCINIDRSFLIMSEIVQNYIAQDVQDNKAFFGQAIAERNKTLTRHRHRSSLCRMRK